MNSLTLDNLVAPISETNCKICKSTARLFGVADFNKNCAETMGVHLSIFGVGIYYHKCTSCGLIFTTAFDRWSYADFKKYIYNKDYIQIDPDYVIDRPTNNAKVVGDFIKRGRNIQLLDYGGGSGKFAELLCEKGIHAKSWDPMEENQIEMPKESFDIVTAFEVFEHTPNPKLSTTEALSFLKPDGVFLFSTLTEEKNVPRAFDFWYIAPRNGHVTIYTKQSLQQLFKEHGYNVMHFDDLTHMAYKTLPYWLS